MVKRILSALLLFLMLFMTACKPTGEPGADTKQPSDVGNPQLPDADEGGDETPPSEGENDANGNTPIEMPKDDF